MHFATAKSRVSAGFTLIEILAIAFVIVLLAGLILPVTNGSRCGSQTVRCIINLKNVGLAYRIFATDNSDRFPWEVPVAEGGARELHALGEPFHTFRVLSNELSTPKILICPQDKPKKPSSSWTNLTDANISYFINIAAQSTNPQSWLGGDRNLAINGRRVASGRLHIPRGSSASFDKEFHGTWGNLLRADGSVEQLSGARLLSETNHESYVLLIP